MLLVDSSHVQRHDKAQHSLILKNGSSYSYHAMVSQKEAVFVESATIHIFFSEACEDKFVREHGITCRSDLPAKASILDFRATEIFEPLVVNPAHIQDSPSTCTHCGSNFRNLHKSFGINPIVGMMITPGQMNKAPDPKHYGIAFSDMHAGRPVRNYYLFRAETNTRNLSNMSFCSNEFGFAHAIGTESLVIFKNNVMGGMLAVISPYTEKVNLALSNPYKLRPQKLQQD